MPDEAVGDCAVRLAGEALQRFAARADDRARNAADAGDVVRGHDVEETLLAVVDLRWIELGTDELRRLRVGVGVVVLRPVMGVVTGTFVAAGLLVSRPLRTHAVDGTGVSRHRSPRGRWRLLHLGLHLGDLYRSGLLDDGGRRHERVDRLGEKSAQTLRARDTGC